MVEFTLEIVPQTRYLFIKVEFSGSRVKTEKHLYYCREIVSSNHVC